MAEVDTKKVAPTDVIPVIIVPNAQSLPGKVFVSRVDEKGGNETSIIYQGDSDNSGLGLIREALFAALGMHVKGYQVRRGRSFTIDTDFQSSDELIKFLEGERLVKRQ